MSLLSVAAQQRKPPFPQESNHRTAKDQQLAKERRYIRPPNYTPNSFADVAVSKVSEELKAEAKQLGRIRPEQWNAARARPDADEIEDDVRRAAKRREKR